MTLPSVCHKYRYDKILGFFTCTQQHQEWRKPVYQFTARQKQKWNQLWQLVQHPEPGPALQPGDEDIQSWILGQHEQACLEFCIELLNQHYQTYEYESALVCAMAVLGCKVNGWHDPDSYPTILSRVIKIAHFFVVERALWLDPAARQIVGMWQMQLARVTWAVQSADDDLPDLDEDSASRMASSSITIRNS
ncbi:hypothetical protein H4217_003005 [Coemansia sp. RSA 1939]|nr:hypothetical protein H4217_003005 [Coemansia sp. RSA 1939]